MEREIVWRDERIVVRRLALEHAPLLARWLSDPRVLRYYEGRDQPHDLTRIREHFYPEGETVERRCLVEYDGAPIGYLQIYPLDAPGLAEYGYPPDERIDGMDLFIGEPDHWDRGIGTALVAGVAQRLLVGGADAVVVDPRLENARAIRCYAKAGFRQVRTLPRHELHEGVWHDCALMERRLAGRSA